MSTYGWEHVYNIETRKFICGYCGQAIASNIGYFKKDLNSFIYICHFCEKPTYISVARGEQVPGRRFGENVHGVEDKNISDLYDEARSCITGNAYTAAVLCCRKLLMNIAVSKGAKEGLKFIEYVEYLASKNYVPPDGNDWVDHIRKKGNEATHEIRMMAKEDAEDLIAFCGMLLKFIYEFPAKVKMRNSK